MRARHSMTIRFVVESAEEDTYEEAVILVENRAIDFWDWLRSEIEQGNKDPIGGIIRIESVINSLD